MDKQEAFDAYMRAHVANESRSGSVDGLTRDELIDRFTMLRPPARTFPHWCAIQGLVFEDEAAQPAAVSADLPDDWAERAGDGAYLVPPDKASQDTIDSANTASLLKMKGDVEYYENQGAKPPIEIKKVS